MGAKEGECTQCGEVISNPVCTGCLKKEIETSTEQSLGEEYQPEGDVRCILCGKPMSICSGCYVEDTLDIISRESPERAEELETYFGRHAPIIIN